MRPRTSPFTRCASAAVVVFAAMTSGSSIAEARRVRAPVVLPTGPSPVTFRAEQEPGTWRVRWTLQNVSGAAVDVAADRRLVWIEVPPPVELSPPTRGRRRRAPRVTRCVHEARPWSSEVAVRARLAPGETYSELIDLRDQCRLRVPPSAFAAPVTVRYGFAPFEGRRRPSLRSWNARTITLDARAYPVNDLTATVSLTAPPPEAPTATSPQGFELSVRDAEAASGAGLQASLRLSNAGQRTLYTLWRTVLVSFELTTPSGRTVACDGVLRDPNPFREFFVRLNPGGARVMRLVPDEYCPAGAFDEAGIYRATAAFETHGDGEPWLRGAAFTGRVVSRPFVFRIGRGQTQYRPFGLRVTGGAVP